MINWVDDFLKRQQTLPDAFKLPTKKTRPNRCTFRDLDDYAGLPFGRGLASADIRASSETLKLSGICLKPGGLAQPLPVV